MRISIKPMRALRRNLRNQREDENEIYAKSEYISDGAIDFYKIDHAGDISERV